MTENCGGGRSDVTIEIILGGFLGYNTSNETPC
jgi:hypothetical protein